MLIKTQMSAVLFPHVLAFQTLTETLLYMWNDTHLPVKLLFTVRENMCILGRSSKLNVILQII